MKLNKFTLTLTAAALLPTFAYAGTDEVAASFERDLQRGAAVVSVTVAKAYADPLDTINNTVNKEADAVVASFDRDLYREPTASLPVLIARISDPLEDAIYAALYGTSDQVLASFEHGLYREPIVTHVAVNGFEADAFAEAVNVALRNETEKPVAHATIEDSNS